MSPAHKVERRILFRPLIRIAGAANVMAATAAVTPHSDLGFYLHSFLLLFFVDTFVLAQTLTQNSKIPLHIVFLTCLFRETRKGANVARLHRL